MINRKKASNCVLVQWREDNCRFIVVDQVDKRPRLLNAGLITCADPTELGERLSEEMAGRKIHCRQVVLLLPRSELDVTAISLPAASDEELPQLVENAVAMEVDEPDLQVTDFLVSNRDDSGCEAFAFSLRKAKLDTFRDSITDAGFRLSAVTHGGLGVVELLRHLAPKSDGVLISVAIGDTGIDLAVSETGKTLVCRNVPMTPGEDGFPLQLRAEISRSLAMVHKEEDVSHRLYLFGETEELSELARELSEKLAFSLSIVNPFDRMSAHSQDVDASRFANLVGIAHGWLKQELEVDFLRPKRPVPPAGPWRRVAFWGSVAIVALLALGFVVWDQRDAQLREIAEREEKLKKLQFRAEKARGVQDVVVAVDRWREDEVVWLDELKRLSDSLPIAGDALIRRMNLSTDSSGNGVVDLSVQVSRPEIVAQLEGSVRDDTHSISSKRVAESDATAKFPWTFDTRVVFERPPLTKMLLADDEKENAPDASVTQDVSAPAAKEGREP